MANRITTFILLALSSLSLTHCASKPQKPSNRIRYAAVREAAVTYGAQSGLAWASNKTNAILEHHAAQLDRTFDFSSVLLKHHLLPPVVSEGAESMNLNDGQAIRFADRVYKIERDARFVSTPPTWRNYISLNYDHVAAPDKVLLPQTKEEKRLWREGVREGWNQGIVQARQLFDTNLALLQHEYVGMHLYRILLKKNMISKPFVAQVKMGVTGDPKKMRINDRVMRITSHSNLMLDSKKWKPIIIKP